MRAETAVAREQALANLRLRERYTADMAVVQSRIQQGNIPLAQSLLMLYQPQPEQEDLRGFEWHLYHRMTRGDQLPTLTGSGDCRLLAISKDGTLLAAAGEKPGVLLFNPAGSQIDRQLPTKGDLVSSLALPG